MRKRSGNWETGLPNTLKLDEPKYHKLVISAGGISEVLKIYEIVQFPYIHVRCV